MNRLSRATALKIAAVLSFLLGVYSMINMSSYLVRGAADLTQAGDAPPYFIVILAFALAVVKIVAAIGAWQNQRWGVVVTLLANALDTVSAVPGLLFAPTTYSQISASIGTIFGIVIIVLCLWRDRKTAPP
jgi:uncharacterized membrane protein (DUF2068 family)